MIYAYRPRTLTGFYTLLVGAQQERLWRIYMADSMWALATGQRIRPEAWKPYSEMIRQRSERRDTRSGREILNDTAAHLRGIAERG